MSDGAGPGPVDRVEQVVIRDEIRQLAYRYADAVDRRDIDLLVSLFAPTARFPPFGDGPEGCRAMFEESLASVGVAVLLVANHLIEIDDATRAHGSVWCHGHIDDGREGFIDQLIRYDDRYELIDGTWCFSGRRHRLWYGAPRRPSPLDQPAADWPERQIGRGSVPYDDPAWIDYWRRHELPTRPNGDQSAS